MMCRPKVCSHKEYRFVTGLMAKIYPPWDR